MDPPKFAFQESDLHVSEHSRDSNVKANLEKYKDENDGRSNPEDSSSASSVPQQPSR